MRRRWNLDRLLNRLPCNKWSGKLIRGCSYCVQVFVQDRAVINPLQVGGAKRADYVLHRRAKITRADVSCEMNSQDFLFVIDTVVA